MSKQILTILLSACFAATMARAAEPSFIGKWKLDSARSRLPDEMKVQNEGKNTYAFDFGGGVETVAVDGTYQKGLGGTLLSVNPQAQDTWIVERKQGGRRLLVATWKLSKDGRTLTDYFRQPKLSMDYVYQRTGQGSGFAGDWLSVKETMNSPLSLEVKAFQGDGLSFVSFPSRTSRNVKLNGADYPDVGPNATRGASSSGRSLDDHTLAITGKYAGKVIFTEEVALSANRKTLTLTQHIPGKNRPNVLVYERT